MSVVTPSKIFIDPREEITFVLERVLNAEKDQVIIVAPQNSALLSSIISLKVLKRRLANTSKLAILVTEDEYGLEIANKVGLVAVQHISDINPELWISVEQIKNEDNALLNNKKATLLSDRTLPENVESLIEERQEQIAEEVAVTDEVPAAVADENDTDEEESVQGKDEELEKELKKYQKPRREAKAVEIDGISILAGGDVRSLQNKKENDTISTEPEPHMKKTKKQEPIGERPTREISSFTGKDFTKRVTSQKSIFNTIAGFFSFQPKNTRAHMDPAQVLSRRRRRRILIGVSVFSFIALFLFAWFYITSVFSSVDVEVTFTKEDVAFNEKIVASVDIEEIDAENLQIPAQLLQEENLDTQLNGTATGEGTKGEKANGFVTIYNTTPADITINSGTTITSVATGLKYVILEDVLVDAAAVDDSEIEGIDVVGSSDDIRVEAAEVGSNYNITSLDSNTIFEIQGFSGVDEIYAKRFNAFEGGTSESFVAVAQSDVESLEDEARKNLIDEGTAKLKAFVPRGYILLEETIEFEEEEVRPFPAIGEEAKDGKFTFNISGNISALAVRSEDLEDVTKQVLSLQDELTEIPSLEDYEVNITEVVRDANRVSFNIDSTGLFSNQKTNEELIELIKGKSIEEAVRILSDLEEIEDVSITYSPSVIPSNFQRVPNDAGRISVTIN